MGELDLTQEEADRLIQMEKTRVNDHEWNFPQLGGLINIPLVSIDKRENFSLDIRRGRIDLLKVNYQNRARQIIVLIRLDFGGQPHRNPDGYLISSPHLHIYREGYADKWAFSVPNKYFPDTSSPGHVLDDFIRYCNIINPPRISKGLFAC